MVSWLLLFRKRLKAFDRLKTGESDEILFQAHYLLPIGDSGDFMLFFRNIAPSMTIDALYENEAARRIVKRLTGETTLKEPILPTRGTMGFEILNKSFGHIAGHLATTPFERENWLFVMTCEDRQVVRRRCVRCFLVRPDDLARFEDWTWCRTHLRCEQPWHWYRMVALHQISKDWRKEEQEFAIGGSSSKGMPLLDEHVTHRRVRSMSAGICPNEKPTGKPVEIPWDDHESELRRLAG